MAKDITIDDITIYKDLLIKYMKFLLDTEGSTLLHRCSIDIEFSEYEMEKLLQLEDLAEKEYYDI